MINSIKWKNKWKFLIVCLIINIIYLLELLPNLGISLPFYFSSRKVLMFLFFISIILIFYRKKFYINRFSFLFFLMNGYCFFITFMNNTLQQQPFYYYFSAIMYPWIITYIFEYLFSNLNDQNKVQNVSVIMSLTSLVYFFLLFQYKNSLHTTLTASGEASIYFILTLMPFVLCCKGKFKNVFLILCITAVFIALKRAALIGIISSLFAYFLVKFKKQDEKKFKLVLYCMIGVLIFIIIYQIIVKYTGNDLIEKMMNIKDDGGSNREYIYNQVFEKFRTLNFNQKLFGLGFNGVRYGYNISSAGVIVSAHNDFLEVLCDYGFIGLLFYMIFIKKIIQILIHLKKIESPYAPACAAALVMFFVLSMFSHLLLYTSYFINLLIFFVMVEHIANQNKKEVRIYGKKGF